MDPERTTTMGECESERTERVFQSMKAVERTRAKLRSWTAGRRAGTGGRCGRGMRMLDRGG